MSFPTCSLKPFLRLFQDAVLPLSTVGYGNLGEAGRGYPYSLIPPQGTPDDVMVVPSRDLRDLLLDEMHPEGIPSDQDRRSVGRQTPGTQGGRTATGTDPDGKLSRPPNASSSTPPF